MQPIFGFITFQGEYLLYSMPLDAWFPLRSGSERKKGKSKKRASRKENRLDKPEILTLTEDSAEEWLEARIEFQEEADEARDEILDRGGDIEDSRELLPAVWLNIDEKQLYIVESMVSEDSLEPPLPEGWQYFSLSNLSELAELLPATLQYWRVDDEMEFDGEDAKYAFDDDGEEEYESEFDEIHIGDGFSEADFDDEDDEFGFDDSEDELF